MINIKNIIITSGISVIFGFYSICNIILYLNYINKINTVELNAITKKMYETNKKYEELNLEFDSLKNKYEHLKNENNDMKVQIFDLNSKMSEMETKQFNSIISYTFDNLSSISSENSIKSQNIDNESINYELLPPLICDDKCDLNNEKPNHKLETMVSKNINDDFIESLNYDYSVYNSGIKPFTIEKETRTRSLSITDVDWPNLAKKFLFG
jgi:hypothetical protein